MLILTRRIGEGVIIGDDIRVVVLEVRGKQVRLGIEAPMDVVVLRDEIYQRLNQENLHACDFFLPDVRIFLQSMNGRKRSNFIPAESSAEVPRLAIDSPKLGTVQIPEDQIITFDHGLLGFNDQHRYALLARPETMPLLLLQCVDRPDLSFLVAEPFSLVDHFKLGRLQSTLHELEARSHEDLQVLVALTIPPGRPGEATANLVSPILINHQSHLGKQVVMENHNFSHQHRILE